MRFRFGLMLLAVLVLAACNLSSEPDDTQPLVTATAVAGGKPVVTITAPQNGSEVVLGDKVLISATASDNIGVQRVQLIANGQIVKTVSSESPSGDRALNVVLDYTPRDQGNASLQVIAYRGAVASDPTPLTLVVRQRSSQVTSTPVPVNNAPVIDPNDPTCRALTSVGLNLRVGPSTNYNVLLVLPAGSVLPIVGRLGVSTNEWWQVRSGTTFGWISAPYTTQYGNCSGVAVVVPPPSPTSPALPTSTLAPTLTIPAVATLPPPTSASSLPDLVISNISGPQTLTLPGGGAEAVATYAITITNAGGSATGQFNNVIVKIPGNVEIPLGVVGQLNASESILLTVEVTFASAGNYALQIRADSGSNVNELSEVNNSATYNVAISG